METKMFIYRPGHEVEERTVDIPGDPGYQRLKQILEPLLDDAPLEHVNVLFDGRRTDMFVNEIGQLQGLAHNEAATKIYRAGYLEAHPETDPETLADIAGPAIVFSRQVWF